MKNLALARRYARALLDIAEKGGADGVRATGAELDQVAALFEASAEFREALTHPAFASGGDKAASPREKAIAAVVEKLKLGKSVARFLAVVAEEHRAELLPEMAAAYRDLGQAGRRVSATVTSAIALDETRRAKLEKVMSGRYPGHDIEFKYVVDPLCLGGLVVEVGHRVLDDSVAYHLQQVQSRLTAAA